MLPVLRKLSRNQKFRSIVPYSSVSSYLVNGRVPAAQRLRSSQTQSRVIFSGIQPTGVPHLGNYLGALQQWKILQDFEPPSTRLLFSIVDLHAITIGQNPDQLRRWSRETLATLLAVGLDPERSTIFYQSEVRFAQCHYIWCDAELLC